MRDAFRLFVIVGKAALIAIGGLIALVLTLSLFGFNPDHKSAWAGILVLTACLLPIGVATSWMLRRLRTVYPQREARAVSIAFGLFTPISLALSMVLAEITGGYADILVRWRFSGAVGAFVGAIVIAAFLSFLVCALVLRITRLAISIEHSD
jgi:fructose-specific phosphotransferase system IIC component